MGILGPLSDTSLSPRENELKSLSSFFSRACLVGQWSPHPETNARLSKCINIIVIYSLIRNINTKFISHENVSNINIIC